MPLETGEAVEEAEFEEVADAEVGDGAEIWREAVNEETTLSCFRLHIALMDVILCVQSIVLQMAQ